MFLIQLTAFIGTYIVHTLSMLYIYNFSEKPIWKGKIQKEELIQKKQLIILELSRILIFWLQLNALQSNV